MALSLKVVCLVKTTSAKTSHYVLFSVERSGLICSGDLISVLIEDFSHKICHVLQSKGRQEKKRKNGGGERCLLHPPPEEHCTVLRPQTSCASFHRCPLAPLLCVGPGGLQHLLRETAQSFVSSTLNYCFGVSGD